MVYCLSLFWFFLFLVMENSPCTVRIEVCIKWDYCVNETFSSRNISNVLQRIQLYRQNHYKIHLSCVNISVRILKFESNGRINLIMLIYSSRQKQLQKTFEFFYCSYVTTTKIVSLRFVLGGVGHLKQSLAFETTCCNLFMSHFDEICFKWPQTLIPLIKVTFNIEVIPNIEAEVYTFL